MTIEAPIYLDYAATTPVDPRVLEKMLPYFCESFGNAASRTHRFGWAAEEAVDAARSEVAKTIGAGAREIVWTSGATEADNLAIKGVAEHFAEKGSHIVTVVTEHKAVLDSCEHLERGGHEVTYLGVDGGGRITAGQVEAAITENTVLVSVMFANNETGVLHPISEIGEVCRAHGVLFHCDAAQAFGKVPIDVEKMQIDLMSLSAHKIYGPKGVGALYVRRREPRVVLAPQIHGGGHERGNRSGTLNVSGIVGFGEAARVAREEMEEESARILGLRERLRGRLVEEIPHVHLNGSCEHRLPGTLNVSFAGVDGEGLLLGLKDVAVSAGAACTSESLEPSYVLRAMGLADDLAHSSLRITIGRFTTREEVDHVVDAVRREVERQRELSPRWRGAREGGGVGSVQRGPG